MNHKSALRVFSKFTCLSTLTLIFIGGMVTSTGSGLAVPDWPLSYGTLFPPMIGGVFYEHGHRMAASFVGLCMLVLCIWLWMRESRLWVKVLGSVALGTVVLQGILGGITVLYLLPTPISVAHGMFAQTFLLMTIFIAYSQSKERASRIEGTDYASPFLQRWALGFLGVLYLQLALGALMRHTESGLAIYDFPTMAGAWWPKFDSAMLGRINAWRFDHDLDPVTLSQILYHFLHRLGALLVIVIVTGLNIALFQLRPTASEIFFKTILWIDGIVITQVGLGIVTVLTGKAEVVASLHVVTGAATLGLAFLLFLRAAPVTLRKNSL